jgi:hypothetical protein
MDFDISTPIDQAKAMEIFGGSTQLFYAMLSKIEDMTFTTLMEKIAEDYEQRDALKF